MLTVMRTFSLCGQFVLLGGALFLSARRTVRARGFLDGIIGGALWLYGLLIGVTFLSSVVIPGILILLGVNTHVVIVSFPEAICMTPVFLLGWFPALVFAIIVRHASDSMKIARGKKPERPPLC